MTRIWMLAAAVLAAAAPVMAQKAAPPPAPAVKAEAPLAAIHITGNRQITTERILAITDLKLGSVVSKGDFEAARQRLARTGAFETVGYVYKPAADGESYDLTIEVHEIELTYPYRFERLPVADDVLRKALRAQEPLWGDRIPQAAIERYVDVIAHSGVDVPLTWKIETADGQPTIVFEPATKLQNIAKVEFEGNNALPATELLRAINDVAIGVPYTEEALRLRLDAAVRPLYDARGRIRVSFPKITVKKSAKLDGVDVTVTVDEGPVYKLGEIQFTGVSAGEARTLARQVDLAKGDTANFDDVNKAVTAAETKYRNNGYLHVSSKVTRDVHGADHTVNVSVAMTLGPQYHFGKVTINGLDLLTEPEIRKAWGNMEGRPYQPDYANRFLDGLRAEKVFDNLGKTSAEPHINETTKTVDITLNFAVPKP